MTQYETWCASPALTDEERQELTAIAHDDKEIESRFWAPLSFGTAGLRGILGMGTHRMNRFVVAQTTQALANLILQNGPEALGCGVAISYDCRHHSEEFAKTCACVLAGNGIHVYLFDALRPTPELSFAIRHYGCIAGINITASHNPKEYNGYKVYWEDGAQLPPDEADVVAQEMERIDCFTGPRSMPYDRAQAEGLIQLIGQETDEAFLQQVLAMAINPDCVRQVADDFKLVYTPFHGTGHYLVPEALRRLGYRHVLCVPEQMVIDGDFPTVKSPNPEDKAGFALAIELAKQNDVDLIIGTDPDADRVGIILRDANGEYVTLSGNQVGVLLLDYIITARERAGTLPEHPAAIKTIVTTEMARQVCDQHGVACFDTFTGFKFIAEKIKELEESGSHRYLFAYEESYGYLCGDFARDKDAVTASLLIAEMAAYYRTQGMTLYDAMERLYDTYGAFAEQTVNLVMPGLDGLAAMQNLMQSLRDNPPRQIDGTAVAAVRDYLSGVRRTADGAEEKMELAGSNVLYFELADGCHYIVRPSGTEPKIKVYLLARGATRADARAQTERYARHAQTLIQK